MTSKENLMRILSHLEQARISLVSAKFRAQEDDHSDAEEGISLSSEINRAKEEVEHIEQWVRRLRDASSA